MADTKRTLSALQALFADNTTKQISPQKLRDFLVSAYGSGYVTAVTGTPYSVGADDDVLLINVASASTVNLPAAASNQHRLLYIKNLTINTVTVDGNASETIDGQLTQVIKDQYTCMLMACDGSNWYIL